MSAYGRTEKPDNLEHKVSLRCGSHQTALDPAVCTPWVQDHIWRLLDSPGTQWGLSLVVVAL